MTYESQAVDDLIRFSMGGITTVSRIMGDFSHRILNLIYFCMRDTSSSRGGDKVRSMVKSERDLKIIPIRDDDLDNFCKSASRMDITYCVLKDCRSEGISNILIYASDSMKASKIMKRGNMEKVNVYEKYPSSESNVVLNDLPDTVALKKDGDMSLNPTDERKTEKSQSDPILEQYPQNEFRSLPVKERMEMLNRQAQTTLNSLRERPMNLPKAPVKEQDHDLTLPLSVAKPVEK